MLKKLHKPSKRTLGEWRTQQLRFGKRVNVIENSEARVYAMRKKRASIANVVFALVCPTPRACILCSYLTQKALHHRFVK